MRNIKFHIFVMMFALVGELACLAVVPLNGLNGLGIGLFAGCLEGIALSLKARAFGITKALRNISIVSLLAACMLVIFATYMNAWNFSVSESVELMIVKFLSGLAFGFALVLWKEQDPPVKRKKRLAKLSMRFRNFLSRIKTQQVRGAL